VPSVEKKRRKSAPMGESGRKRGDAEKKVEREGNSKQDASQSKSITEGFGGAPEGDGFS